MKMTCEKIEMLFADALGGELEPGDREILDGHLGSCADCRTEFSALTDTAALLRERLTNDRHVADAIAARDGEVKISNSGGDVGLGAQNGVQQVSVNRSTLWSTLLRYAAVIVLSFGFGFAVRGGLNYSKDSDKSITSDAGQNVSVANVSNNKETPSRNSLEATLEARLMAAHQAAPHASDFTKSLMAILGG